MKTTALSCGSSAANFQTCQVRVLRSRGAHSPLWLPQHCAPAGLRLWDGSGAEQGPACLDPVLCVVAAAIAKTRRYWCTWRNVCVLKCAPRSWWHVTVHGGGCVNGYTHACSVRSCTCACGYSAYIPALPQHSSRMVVSVLLSLGPQPRTP